MADLRPHIAWFKRTFGQDMERGIAGTAFSVDMLTAVALQETGYIWMAIRDKVSIDRLLELCVGDTLDAPNRSAFPKTKADLVKAPRGAEMFDVARAALVDMAKYVGGYSGAAKNPNKFCHGYGIWQYDIQFFKTDPDYFLERRWRFLPDTLGKCVKELGEAQKRAKLGGKTSLTSDEMAHVAIAYNRGSFNPAKGLKQGFKDSSGVYYGENFAAYLKLAQSVHVDGGTGAIGDPTAPRPVARQTLRRGDKGEAVETMQRLLGVKIDGDFGRVTEAEVRSFQRKHSLVVDGAVGTKTWLALERSA